MILSAVVHASVRFRLAGLVGPTEEQQAYSVPGVFYLLNYSLKSGSIKIVLLKEGEVHVTHCRDNYQNTIN